MRILKKTFAAVTGRKSFAKRNFSLTIISILNIIDALRQKIGYKIRHIGCFKSVSNELLSISLFLLELEQ